eukprot:1161966-Pelagomonas_calceolata.AAC.1
MSKSLQIHVHLLTAAANLRIKWDHGAVHPLMAATYTLAGLLGSACCLPTQTLKPAQAALKEVFRALPAHADTEARTAALKEVRQAIDRLATAIGPTHMLSKGALRHLARMMVSANVTL